MEPVIHRKETFLDGRVMLLHANSMELLQDWKLEKPNHCFTDPPYIDAVHKGARKNVKGGGRAVELGINFACFTEEDCQNLARNVAKIVDGWMIYFCAWEHVIEYVNAVRMDDPKAWGGQGVWKKKTPTLVMTKNRETGLSDRPAPVGEMCAIIHGSRKKASINSVKPPFWEMDVERGEKLHPNQKPPPLFRDIIEQYSQPDDLILEPFMGSATTVRAAIETGRRVIGIEMYPKPDQPITDLLDVTGKNPDYFGLACERTQEAVNNLNALGFITRQTPKGVKVAPATTMGLV